VIRGLYSSANGLLAQSLRTDVIAGNLAGLSVAGLRGEIASVSSFERRLDYLLSGAAAGPAGPAALLAPAVGVNLQPGPIRATGGRFDLALEGPGYFSVQTSSGEAYTRGGAFRLDAAGRLVTLSGAPVLGEAGPIRVTGSDFQVQENGEVLVDGARVDRLKVVELPAGAALRKLGQALLGVTIAPGQALARPASLRVRQGYLEEANVNAVSELVSMITALRAFEASQRALQASDRTLDKAINDIGRV